MPRRVATPTPEAVEAAVKEAGALRKQYIALLETISRGENLSSPVRAAASRISDKLETEYSDRGNQITFKNALARAEDELGIGSPNRVDTDELKVPHGVVVLFRVWQDAKAEKRMPKDGDGKTEEYATMISRFMRSHSKLEISPNDKPWGSGDKFTITGKKRDRVKLQEDARWPKLQEALEDIYCAEHLPGYADSRPPRQIKNATKHVFG